MGRVGARGVLQAQLDRVRPLGERPAGVHLEVAGIHQGSEFCRRPALGAVGPLHEAEFEHLEVGPCHPLRRIGGGEARLVEGEVEASVIHNPVAVEVEPREVCLGGGAFRGLDAIGRAAVEVQVSFDVIGRAVECVRDRAGPRCNRVAQVEPGVAEATEVAHVHEAVRLAHVAGPLAGGGVVLLGAVRATDDAPVSVGRGVAHVQQVHQRVRQLHHGGKGVHSGRSIRVGEGRQRAPELGGGHLRTERCHVAEKACHDRCRHRCAVHGAVAIETRFGTGADHDSGGRDIAGSVRIRGPAQGWRRERLATHDAGPDRLHHHDGVRGWAALGVPPLGGHVHP